jgi:2-phosphosulfolactate phosphatase
MRKLQVCLSPALIPAYSLQDTIAVVIDVFRATTSMCFGLANGAEAIIPVVSVEACLAYQPTGYLLAAERDGKVVEGFDFGNSPFSYVASKVKGKTIVLTTTNGTKALEACKAADQILIASFLNSQAIADYLASQSKHVLLVCAGWKDHPGLEDVTCAGKIIEVMNKQNSILDDGAHLALAAYQQAKSVGLSSYLQRASHTQRMKGLDLQADIELCLQEDLLNIVPALKEGRLILKEGF